jgi:hypothetical protein
MPGRSNRDFMQGTLHRFAQSIGLASKDDDDGDPPPAKPAAAPPKPAPSADKVDTTVSGAAQAMKNATSAADKAVDDAS